MSRELLIVINDILEGIDTIGLPEMFRKDEFNPKYRRVIARHYKILYRAEGMSVFIAEFLTPARTRVNLKGYNVVLN
ncbi:MAG TPA: hypothetical protein VEC12_14955 [Bacteroidia bacterium]|nr:hypothetical protein [Bacteroidia bacterium]